MIAAPIAFFEEAKIDRIGIIGDYNDAAAGFYQPRNRREYLIRLLDMLDSLDHKNEIVAVGFEIERFDAAEMHFQTGPFSRDYRPAVEINAFKLPGLVAEFLKQSEMESVAAADIEDPCVVLQRPAVLKQPLGFEPGADLMN